MGHLPRHSRRLAHRGRNRPNPAPSWRTPRRRGAAITLVATSSRYAKSIRAIEEVTGLDFMPDGEAEVEVLENAPAETDPW